MTSSAKPTFFIDWCLGKTVAAALLEVGAQVEHHHNHFDQDTPDSEWLPVVGERGWIVLTKDKAMGKNLIELRAIARGNVRVFALVSGQLRRQQMADLFVHALARLEKFAQSNDPPFIAKIYKDGRVELWKDQVKLLGFLAGDSHTDRA